MRYDHSCIPIAPVWYVIEHMFDLDNTVIAPHINKGTHLKFPK